MSSHFPDPPTVPNPANPPPPGHQDWSIHDSNRTLCKCLTTSTRTRPTLPPELILQILDHPSRWHCPINPVFPDPSSSISRPMRLPASRGHYNLVSTPPLRDISKIKRIVFSFTSKDQGWSSFPRDHGTYKNTWSWFEAVLEPEGLTADELALTAHRPKCFELQRNRHAGQAPEKYEIEMREESELFAQLKEGWSLKLVARAFCPGWENQIHEAAIEVWCVDHLTGDERH